MYTDLNRGWNLGPLKAKPWVIEKQRRLTCFGNPGYIDQWDYWHSYDTREEAEKALKLINMTRDPTKNERYQITDNRQTQWVMK